MELEQAIQRADKKLGNDGDIALAYWDLDLHKEVPTLITEYFTDFPDSFKQCIADMGGHKDLDKIGLKRSLKEEDFWKLGDKQAEQLQKVLGTPECTKAWADLEKIHGTMHGMAGGVMFSMIVCGFDPCFYLHHVNVDRMFESWLVVNKNKPSTAEWLKKNGRGVQLPFTGWTTEEILTPDCKDLGFYYEDIIKGRGTRPPKADQDKAERDRTGSMIRQMPTYARFQDLDHLGVTQTINLFVFLVPKAKAESFKVTKDKAQASPYFAGSEVIFASKGAQCGNCIGQMPQDYLVDVTEFLTSKKLSRHTQTAVCYVHNIETDSWQHIEETALPEPELVGPTFDSHTLDLEIGKSNYKKTDPDMVETVKMVQKYLKKHGYYSGKPKGDFNTAFETALKDFQEKNGLDVTGKIGKTLKMAIVRRRQDPQDDLEFKERANYKNKGTVTFTIKGIPEDLDREQVEADVTSAVKAWEPCTGLKLEYVPNAAKGSYNFIIQWTNNMDLKTEEEFDGPGGCLAIAAKRYINLDRTENWKTSDYPAEEAHGEFDIKTVCIHETGHVLGLAHITRDGNAVMSPYYVYGRYTLTDSDEAKARALYLVE